MLFQPSAVFRNPTESEPESPRWLGAVAQLSAQFVGRNGVNLVSDHRRDDGTPGILVQTSGQGWPHGLPNVYMGYPVSVVHGEMARAEDVESDLGWGLDEVFNAATFGVSGAVKEAVSGPSASELAAQRAAGYNAVRSGTQQFTGSGTETEPSPAAEPAAPGAVVPPGTPFRPSSYSAQPTPAGTAAPGSAPASVPFYSQSWFVPTAILTGAVVLAGGVFWWGNRHREDLS